MKKVMMISLGLIPLFLFPSQCPAFDDDLIIERISSTAGITAEQASLALETVKKSIIDSLKEERGRISLKDFGTFQKVRRKARTGRNPVTGEEIVIQEKDVVKFKPSPELRDEIACQNAE